MLAKLIKGRGHHWSSATAISAIHAITQLRNTRGNSNNSDYSSSNPPNRIAPPFSAQELSDYCATSGLQLLLDDSRFILGRLPYEVQARLRAMDEYMRVWRQAASEEPIQHKKQNTGRHAANTWLREHKNVDTAINRSDQQGGGREISSGIHLHRAASSSHPPAGYS